VATTEQRRQCNLAAIFCVPMLCVFLVACNQSARLAQPSPAAVAPATSDPLVLSGVAYTQGDANTRANASPPPPASADVIAAPPARAPEPVVSATPLPATDPALALPPVTAAQPAPPPTTGPAAAEPLPGTSPPAQVTTADGFPNINLAPQPKEPQTKLLTPEERAKLIEELNALAGRSQ